MTAETALAGPPAGPATRAIRLIGQHRISEAIAALREAGGHSPAVAWLEAGPGHYWAAVAWLEDKQIIAGMEAGA